MSEYNLISKIYDPSLYIFLNPIRKAVVKIIQDLNPEKIIYFCCGTGNQLKYLKKQGFNNLLGIDIDEGMVKQSNKGKYKANCEIKDASDTKYDDNSFDFIMVSLAIHEKNEEIQQKIIKEMYRIVKPGGNILIVDYIYNNNTFKFAKLGVHIIERIAGKEHYSNFKNFIRIGGLDKLVKKNIILEKKIWFNSIVLRLYQG